MDPRHEQRLKTVQNLFASTYPAGKLPYSKDPLTAEILNNLTKIDDLIKQHAPKYPIDRIAKTDLSILRLAVYELIIESQQPHKVIINEAIELAKELGNDRSFAFINAVLGSILKDSEDLKEHEQTI